MAFVQDPAAQHRSIVVGCLVIPISAANAPGMSRRRSTATTGPNTALGIFGSTDLEMLVTRSRIRRLPITHS